MYDEIRRKAQKKLLFPKIDVGSISAFIFIYNNIKNFLLNKKNNNKSIERILEFAFNHLLYLTIKLKITYKTKLFKLEQIY